MIKKRNVPVLYVGAPGVGKTATVRNKYEHCEVLLLSSKTEEDIQGLPYRDGEKERYTTPQFIERIQNAVKEGKKTCLFLDEIDKARREVADTLLTLVTHPQEFGIPECVDIIAAANPPQWGGGDGVSSPMASRFSIIEYSPNITSWLKYMKDKFSHISIIDEFCDAILNKKTPVFEMTGEGLCQRLVCPRTYDLAFECIGEDDQDLKIKGLLNANAASFLLSLLTPKIEASSSVEEQARNISWKHSIGKQEQRKFIRFN